MFSTQALLFPKNSLNEGSKADVLQDFARFMQSEAAQKIWYQNDGRLPTHQSVQELYRKEADSNRQELLAQLKQAKPMPSTPEMTVAWEAMGKGFTRFNDGIFTAEQAAEFMQKLADSELKKIQQQ